MRTKPREDICGLLDMAMIRMWSAMCSSEAGGHSYEYFNSSCLNVIEVKASARGYWPPCATMRRHAAIMP